MLNLLQHKADLLPVGEHAVKVTGLTVLKSETGARTLRVEVKGEAGLGFIRFPLSEKALWKLAGFAAACGFLDDQLQDFDPRQLDGREFLAIVEEYKVQSRRMVTGVTRWSRLPAVHIPDSPAKPAEPEATEEGEWFK